jgi:SAM-dependent methyltransferase
MAEAGPVTRQSLAARYIRGCGIEIGALHAPLAVPAAATVRYVDRVTRAESIRAFPGLDPAGIVEPDYVTDGFSLAAVPDGSQDFVIANHVLEHTPNPLAALMAWHRVLRPEGVIFAAVPLVDRTFDRSRSVTPPEHMLDDWHALHTSAQVTARDMPHYREWVTISLQAISLQNGTPLPPWTPEETEAVARKRMEESDEIHFHTFTCDSYRALLTQVVPDLLPDLELVELHECSGYEAVAVLIRKAARR